jgi:adenine-specific DNA-methyltransferase
MNTILLIYNRQDKTFPEIRIYELASLPIIQINKSHAELLKKITKQVDLVLKLNEELKIEKLPTKKDQLKYHIEHIEEDINQLVYQLYELTPEEIKIVEGGSDE